LSFDRQSENPLGAFLGKTLAYVKLSVLEDFKESELNDKIKTMSQDEILEHLDSCNKKEFEVH